MKRLATLTALAALIVNTAVQAAVDMSPRSPTGPGIPIAPGAQREGDFLGGLRMPGKPGQQFERLAPRYKPDLGDPAPLRDPDIEKKPKPHPPPAPSPTPTPAPHPYPLPPPPPPPPPDWRFDSLPNMRLPMLKQQQFLRER